LLLYSSLACMQEDLLTKTEITSRNQIRVHEIHKNRLLQLFIFIRHVFETLLCEIWLFHSPSYSIAFPLSPALPLFFHWSLFPTEATRDEAGARYPPPSLFKALVFIYYGSRQRLWPLVLSPCWPMMSSLDVIRCDLRSPLMKKLDRSVELCRKCNSTQDQRVGSENMANIKPRVNE
jgi:hypothetical protein